MSTVQLVLEQPGPLGKMQHISFQVRDNLFIGDVIDALVQHFHLPLHDKRGLPITYQLRLAVNSNLLSKTQRCADFHLAPGTRVRLEAKPVHQPTVLDHPSEKSPQFQQKYGSRRYFLITGGILVASSLAGLFSGAATALAHRAWSRSVQNPLSPLQTPLQAPPVQSPLTLQLQFRFTAHRATVRALAFSPDGKLLASGADDALVLIWTPDGSIRHEISHLHAVRAVAWSPGGQRLATGSGNTVAFLSVESGTFLAVPPPRHFATVSGLAWSLEPGHPVVSCGLDKRAVVWETTHYKSVGIFTRHTKPIEAVAVSTGNDATIATASQGGVIRLWTMNTRQERHGFYQSTQMALHAVAFSPRGTVLSAGTHDGMVHIWEKGLICQQSVQATEEVQCIDIPRRLLAHTTAVRALAFSPDGRFLATGGDDGQLILWDTKEDYLPLTKIDQRNPIAACTFSPDGRLLALASGRSVEIWRME